VCEHFEYWGYPKEKLIEKDWGDKIEFGNGISIITETSHGSGRALGGEKTSGFLSSFNHLKENFLHG
jgi:L-ascorbate metabolism protein UlaG (beta-lactamase superfamily)